MQNIINYNLHRRNSIAPNLNEGKNSRGIFINLKYAGQIGDQLMSKMKKILYKMVLNEILLIIRLN